MIGGRTVLGIVAVAVGLAGSADANAALRFRDCNGVRCARLAVPLDRTGAVPGTVSLYVEHRRAARGPAQGTTLLLAGGPGQPSTSTYRGDRRNPYAEFRQYTPRNDILAIDGRGTGRSGLITCRALQRASLVDAGAEAAACARQLGARRGFYRTLDAVEDIEAVRAALGVEKLTLVGVSYGTFLAQAYAAAHPDRVDRLLLDSVLDVSAWDPLYRDIFHAVPRVLRAVCRDCGYFTDDPVADVAQLVSRLARGSLRGRVTQPSGRRTGASLTRQELFFTLVTGDLDEFSRASFPGAVASAVHGDSDPILRLARHAVQSETSVSARDLSAGLYAATTCEEIPFPWTRFSDPSTRFGAVTAAVAQIPAVELYPFDAATDAGNDFIRMCRRWPEASPAPVGPPPGTLPDVPVLMLSGQVDLRTPVETATTAAADWPHAQRLTIPNTGHSVLSADFSGCAQRAARRFFRGQQVGSNCGRRRATALPPLPPAPLSLRQLRPARSVDGRRGRTISAVDLTLFDVVTEFFSSLLASNGPVVRGGGLRGGRWELDLRPDRPALRLRGVEYLPGLRVSGTIRRVLSAKPAGRLRVTGRSGSNGVLNWTPSEVSGRLDGKRVRSRTAGASASAARASTKVSYAELVRAGRRLSRDRLPALAIR
jgi:pimeloyl-ACP methyl ester carboxylesterase